jgi:hypothetical protein
LSAVELYALAWRHPQLSSAQCFIDVFGRRLDAVAGTLPSAIAAAAQARGQALDVWDAAVSVEAELRALGSE